MKTANPPGSAKIKQLIPLWLNDFFTNYLISLQYLYNLHIHIQLLSLKWRVVKKMLVTLLSLENFCFRRYKKNWKRRLFFLSRLSQSCFSSQSMKSIRLSKPQSIGAFRLVNSPHYLKAGMSNYLGHQTPEDEYGIFCKDKNIGVIIEISRWKSRQN